MATEWRELNDQALAAERAGDNKRALRRWRSALVSIREGQGRPEDALLILDQMARHFMRVGEYADAEKALRRIVDITSRVYGNETVPMGKAFADLAEVVRRNGNPDEARELLAKGTRICRDQLGDRHPELLYMLRQKLDCERQLGRLPEAEATCREALTVCGKFYGEQHERTLRHLNQLALLCMEQGKYDEADGIFRRLFETWKGPASNVWRDVVKGLNDLAMLYVARGQHDKATRAAKRAVNIMSDKTQGVPAESLRSHNILGVCSAAQGQLDLARESFDCALIICRKHFGPSDPRIREIEENIARTYMVKKARRNDQTTHSEE